MTDGLGLGDAYSATLSRIKGQGGRKARLGMETLMWISHSERPLKSDELRHALAVEIGSPNFNSDNIPSIGTLLACCQGLVVMDKETSTIRLIHFTLQEHLRAHPELFCTAHSIIAETCLSYLNSQEVKALPVRPFPDLRDSPFLEYSSQYWGMHAKRELSDCAKLLALKLFNDRNNYLSTGLLLKAQGWYISNLSIDSLSLSSGLHCASIFGIDEIVVSLVEMEGYDINQEDCMGNTALMWAARNNHEEVVKILLGRDDVDPNKPDKHGQTPLMLAACNGYEGVVELLLGRDGICPDKPNKSGRTPLWWAAYYGREEVIKILLERDIVDPNKLDHDGRTPLWPAAWNGYEGLVKILLRRSDVSPNEPNNFGQTPLWWAALCGHGGVVKLLLRRDDVNPDKPDKSGRTPLWWAAYSGHEEVVKILLERDDVNPSKPDRYGETPFQQAVEQGHARVIALLHHLTSASHSMAQAGGGISLFTAFEHLTGSLCAFSQRPRQLNRRVSSCR